MMVQTRLLSRSLLSQGPRQLHAGQFITPLYTRDLANRNLTMPNEDSVVVSEHVLEIRHQATGRFLDVRGYVADHIKDADLFPHWQIETNVVNFRDAPKTADRMGAFAGYKSAGLFVYDPDTRNFFQDKATQFWRTLNKNQFYKIPDITRFGCRTKSFLTSDQEFEEINSRLYRQFFSDEFRSLVGEKEKDLQIVIELQANHFEIRMTCGPIQKDEAMRYFGFESEHFSETGLFLDIDVYKTEGVDHKDVPRLTKSAMGLIWERIDRIAAGVNL